MEQATVKQEKSIYYPPGGILIWMIVFLELITFSIALLVYLYQRHGDLEMFNASQHLLNKTLGTINTIVLISSGFFMATTIDRLRNGDRKKSLVYLSVTVLLGILFLSLKLFEYHDKINHGYVFGYNGFFNFYWMLTGFHFIHVLVGTFILIYMFFKVKSGFYHQHNYEDVEASAVFWHMCDLIWIFLFPVIYLLH
jgi:nitric oxide reductase NorE protein